MRPSESGCASRGSAVATSALGGAAGIEAFAGSTVTITAPQAEAMEGFLDLLQRWNRTYNLTAVRDRHSMRTQHLLDCLALVAPLRRHAESQPVRSLLDVGSGGGLPGVVLAILNPGVEVTCVDAVAKKSAFVRQVAGELKLPNLLSRHARIQLLAAEPKRYDVVVSRAFSALNDLVSWSAGVLHQDGVWIAMKGVHPEVEIAALPASVDMFHVEPIQVPGLNASRCLVWMRRRPDNQQ